MGHLVLTLTRPIWYNSNITIKDKDTQNMAVDRLDTPKSLEVIDKYYDTRPIEISNPMLVEVFDSRGMYCSAELNQSGRGAVKGKKEGRIQYYILPWHLLDGDSSDSGENVLAIEPVATVVPEPVPQHSGESVLPAEVHKISSTVIDKAIYGDLNDVSFVPSVDSTYVSWGHHSKVEKIIKSGMFYPTFVTGLSGNGKTFMIEQICAKLKRECVRVNITIETDEDDLLGGFRLINGETVFHKGPVVDAMERGAVLLLDEVDLASNKILCLQPVLEGKGVFLKKVNQWVKPSKGFTVIATANTKGKGSESGSFVGTQILNEAFLERFAVTFEQGYATPTVEKKMLLKHMAEADAIDDGFAEKLSHWAESIRKTYYDDGCDEIISTRRLVHIVKAFGIFGDKMTAVELCISRFDEETKASFLDLYTVHDETVNVDGESEASEVATDFTPFQ